MSGAQRGVELGAAIKTDVATSTSVYPSFTDATGLSITITHGSRPIVLEATAPQLSENVVNGIVEMAIREGSTVLALATISTNGVVNRGNAATARVRLTPDPGVSHTYKVSLAVGIAGTNQLSADPTFPAMLQAVEV